MTREEIEQKAKLYAELLTAGNKEHYRTIYTAAKEGYVTGASSRDEEIKELKEEIESLQEQYNTCFDGFKKRGTNLGELMKENVKLRNPWISVDDRLPEEPFTICAVWLKGDDLVPHISLYDSGRFLLLPVDVTVTHWMPIPELKKGE